MSSRSDPDSISVLIQAGRLDEAATAAESCGDLEQAIELYEKLWLFDRALELAEKLGDLPRAIRLALEARQIARARDLSRQIDDADADTLKRASDAFAGRGRFEDAAHTAVRGGHMGQATDLFRRAGLLVEAARLHVQQDQVREAIELLERITEAPYSTENLSGIRQTTGGPKLQERAEAHLLLGQLLRGMRQPLEAARALQQAARDKTTRVAAYRELRSVLGALQLPKAAAEIKRRLDALGADTTTPAQINPIAPAAPATRTPTRYRLQELLGQGATSRVYRAHDHLLNRTVALKALSLGRSENETQAVERFVREAQIAKRLSHPHIVTLHDVDISSGLLAWDYMPGGSLQSHLAAHTQISLSSTRRLALEILDALASAHDHGIIHRDVKPANIFFDGIGGAQLADFGAAHLQDFGRTQTGGLIGTLAYLSPEQITGAPVGPQTDLYGLAATLFEMLVGRLLFEGPDFVSQHRSTPPPFAAELRRELPAAVDQSLQKALAKAPSERFRSARDMAESITQWPTLSSDGPKVGSAVRPPVQGATVASSSDNPRGFEPEALGGESPVSVIGPTRNGTLTLVRDLHMDRLVVVETRREPLNDLELEQVRALAAKGGPHVQRVLSLSSDLKTISFEFIDGPPIKSRTELCDEDDKKISELVAALELSQFRLVRHAGQVILLTQPQTLSDSSGAT